MHGRIWADRLYWAATRFVPEHLERRIWRDWVTPRVVAMGYRRAKGTPVQEVETVPVFGYDEEDDIRAALCRIRAYTMTSIERMATLWQQVRYLDRYGIQGDLVECGVWKGGSVGTMALAHLRSAERPVRHLRLFDSFEGLPEPRSEVDGTTAVQYAKGRASGSLDPIRECIGTLEENRRLLEHEIKYPAELIHYHVGWFQETLPRDIGSIGDIALLRLDGDWYESTQMCLDYLYPKVVKAGIVIVDDYGFWQGCRRAVDEFIARCSEPILLHHIDYSGRYWVKSV